MLTTKWTPDVCSDMRKDRAAGLTYAQIGEKYGLSKQRVGQLIGHSNKYYFKVIKRSGCKFVNLRNWMNENSISRNEFARMMGLIPSGPTLARIRSYMTGECTPPKHYIDMMLKATGMDYETFFEVG